MTKHDSRSVDLTEKQAAFVEALVKAGRFDTVGDAIREGLRLLKREEEVRVVEAWLDAGMTPEEAASLPADVVRLARVSIWTKIIESLHEDSRAGADGLARWKRCLAAITRTLAHLRMRNRT